MIGQTTSSAVGWTPHTVSSVEVLDPAPVAALHALLDSGLQLPHVGDVLPALWHWVALPRWSPSSALDVDGHPRRGDFLPPIDLPRRMFAGGEVTIHGDLHVGASVIREASVTSVEEKVGRSGPLAIVQVQTLLRDTASLDVLVTERQDIVYRMAAAAADTAAFPGPSLPAAMLPAGPPLVSVREGWRFVTDPTLLMRFSAATANAHRIHYDWPYATRVERYPGLVVNGPLATLALAEALRLTEPKRRVWRLRHRNIAPVFCGTEAHVTVTAASPDTAGVVLSGTDGATLVSLSADLAPTLNERLYS